MSKGTWTRLLVTARQNVAGAIAVRLSVSHHNENLQQFNTSQEGWAAPTTTSLMPLNYQPCLASPPYRRRHKATLNLTAAAPYENIVCSGVLWNELLLIQFPQLGGRRPFPSDSFSLHQFSHSRIPFLSITQILNEMIRWAAWSDTKRRAVTFS